MITQDQLARYLGLSRSTVHAVLANNHRIALSRQTRQRVLEAARTLNYYPSRHAQVMRRGRSGTIGLLQFSGFLHVNDLRAAQAAQAIHAAGYHLQAGHLLWTTRGIQDAVKSIFESRLEGVLLVGPNEFWPESVVEQCRAAGIPLVCLSGVRYRGVPQVRADFRQGAAELTRHLLAHGYRRLALLSNWGSRFDDEAHRWPTLEKAEGLRGAVAARGGDGVETAVIAEDTSPAAPLGFELGRRAMRALLAQPTRPQAVLCTNDQWAIGALAACREAGVRVPEEIAVTGFDDDPVGQFTAPPLTTMAQATGEMARQAVALLLRQIGGEAPADAEDLVRVPCRLVVRQSCGGH